MAHKWNTSFGVHSWSQALVFVFEFPGFTIKMRISREGGKAAMVLLALQIGWGGRSWEVWALCSLLIHLKSSLIMVDLRQFLSGCGRKKIKPTNLFLNKYFSPTGFQAVGISLRQAVIRQILLWKMGLWLWTPGSYLNVICKKFHRILKDPHTIDCNQSFILK